MLSQQPGFVSCRWATRRIRVLDRPRCAFPKMETIEKSQLRVTTSTRRPIVQRSTKRITAGEITGAQCIHRHSYSGSGFPWSQIPNPNTARPREDSARYCVRRPPMRSGAVTSPQQNFSGNGSKESDWFWPTGKRGTATKSKKRTIVLFGYNPLVWWLTV